MVNPRFLEEEGEGALEIAQDLEDKAIQIMVKANGGVKQAMNGRTILVARTSQGEVAFPSLATLSPAERAAAEELGITHWLGTAGEHAETELLSTALSNAGDFEVYAFGVSRSICAKCLPDVIEAGFVVPK